MERQLYLSINWKPEEIRDASLKTELRVGKKITVFTTSRREDAYKKISVFGFGCDHENEARLIFDMPDLPMVRQ